MTPIADEMKTEWFVIKLIGVNEVIFAFISTVIFNVTHLVDEPLIHIFVWVVLVDIFTGIGKAIINKKANSTVGTNGLIKHLTVIFLVTLFSTYLPVFGFENAKSLMVIYFIIIYAISITENLGDIGIPLPTWVKDTLIKLKDGYNKEIDVEDIKSFKMKDKKKTGV